MEEVYEKYKDEVSKEVFTGISKDLARVWKVPLKDQYELKPVPPKDYSYDSLVKEINKFTYTRKGETKELSANSKKSYINKLKKLNQLVDGNIIEKIVRDKDVAGIVEKIKKEWEKSYNDYVVVLIKIIDNVNGLRKLVSDNNYNLLKTTMIEGLEAKQKRTDKRVEKEPLKITWEDYMKAVRKFTQDKDKSFNED